MYLTDKAGTLSGMDPKPMTAPDSPSWAPLMVNGLTVGLVCPACGAVVPPSNEGDQQADHLAECAARND